MPIAILADGKSRRNIIAIATTVWSVMAVLCGFGIVALVYFTTREPERSASEEAGPAEGEAPAFRVVTRHMWRR